MFTSTEALISLQTRRQSIARNQSDHLEQLASLVDLMEIEIEGLRLDVLIQLQTIIDSLAGNPQAADQIGPISSQLNTLVSLGLLIEKLQDLAQRYERSQTRDVAVTGAEDVRFVLRQILGLLTRLGDAPERAVLASQIIQTRSLILDSDGIIENARRNARIQNEIADIVALSFEHIETIEAIIAQTITAASAGAQETGAQLNMAIRSLTVSNLATIAILFGGLILVVVFLVELQLNQRLQSLRAAVRRLSVGNYDDEIPVDGADELGEIADSLRLSQTGSRDLKRSNADLQSFAYAASHDLKTPLRAITDLAEWTLEDARDELSEDNRENLVLLSQRSERLSSLLDGLLLYAQVDGMANRNEVFDLAKECAVIADLLDPDGHYKVVIDPHHPPFSTSVVPLRQILTNLFSNAMKHHDRETGQINVRATVIGKTVEIEVQDDGPGIPAQYHNKIFELFQKLESADVVEGAGIGLALVKKLSHRHGRGVSLKSPHRANRGTVFTVKMFAGSPA